METLPGTLGWLFPGKLGPFLLFLPAWGKSWVTPNWMVITSWVRLCGRTCVPIPTCLSPACMSVKPQQLPVPLLKLETRPCKWGPHF